MKLQLDCVSFPSLDSHYIRKLLQLDGIMRGRRWALPETDDAVIQIEPTTVLGLSQLNLERTGSLSQSSAKFIRMWRINFLTSFEAAHFARVWHQKPLPKLGNEDLHEFSDKDAMLYCGALSLLHNVPSKPALDLRQITS